MFRNPGEKIQQFAYINFWVAVIASVILAFVYAESILLWLLIAVGGCAAAYISSLLLFGFGTLIENTGSISEIAVSKKNKELLADAKAKNNERLLSAGGWRCSCGKVNGAYLSSCACGKRKVDNA